MVENMGQVRMISNVLIIKKNMTSIIHSEQRAKDMLEAIGSVHEKEASELLTGLRKSLRSLVGSRGKRSLLPFVGHLLHGLFGVAQDSDIEREKERLTRIEAWAKNYGHVLDMAVENINQHAQAFDNLTTTVESIVGKLETEITQIERKMALHEMILRVELGISDLKDNLEALRLAHNGQVSMTMLSLKELSEIINYSILNFGFKPLEIDMISHYHLMTCKVIHNVVYIFLPFNDGRVIYLVRIIPFPVRVRNETIIVDEPEKLVLEVRGNDLISVWEKEDLDKCLEIRPEELICSKESFYLQPISNYPCINHLLNGGPNVCNYRQFSYSLYVKVLDFLYVFTERKEPLTLTCEGQEKKMLTKTINVLPKACRIKISNVMHYEPTVFQKVDINISEVNFHYNIQIKDFELPIKLTKMT